MTRFALYPQHAVIDSVLAHSVSYPITIKYNIPHDLVCSFSLPMILASVIGKDVECDKNLCQIFGNDLQSAAAKLENFLNNLSVFPQVRAAFTGIAIYTWDVSFRAPR